MPKVRLMKHKLYLKIKKILFACFMEHKILKVCFEETKMC